MTISFETLTKELEEREAAAEAEKRSQQDRQGEIDDRMGDGCIHGRGLLGPCESITDEPQE